MLYQQISHNKRNTWYVMALFGVLLLAVTFFITYSIGSTIGSIFLLGGLIYVVWVYFNAAKHLMKITNAVEIKQEDSPELYEMVEELCLAGGIPVPKIYITPETAPNAFATGRDPEHASLALTKGLVEIMNKEEIRGVIGHELSHIRNYDIRFTTVASGMVNLIYYTGVGILFAGLGMVLSDEHGIIAMAFRLLGLFLVFIGGVISIVGIPLAKLFYLMISRQREYLADVGSVDLTRDPSGLISALSKLETIETKAESQDIMVDSLYFDKPGKSNFFSQLFSDHPPLDKRIERLQESNK